MTLPTDITSAVAQALNGHFDVNESTGIIQSLNEIYSNPRLATLGSVGSVLKMTDPGTVPVDATLAFLISYMNTLRDIFIAARMVEEGAGGGS